MKPCVLVVDDEPDVLDLADFKLSEEGFEVIRATTGLEALRKARAESPSVIVLDMRLPDLDGVSVCEILRAQPSTRDVPVVVLSASDRSSVGARGAQTNVSHWLQKGSGFDSLNACVRAALEQHRLRIELHLKAEEPGPDAFSEQ
jgi:DNA-binding response OmpR family regulator